MEAEAEAEAQTLRGEAEAYAIEVRPGVDGSLGTNNGHQGEGKGRS